MGHGPGEVAPREGYGEACHGEHAVLPRPLYHRSRVEVGKLEERVVQVAAAVLVRPYEGQRRERPADDGVERYLGDDWACDLRGDGVDAAARELLASLGAATASTRSERRRRETRRK